MEQNLQGILFLKLWIMHISNGSGEDLWYETNLKLEQSTMSTENEVIFKIEI